MYVRQGNFKIMSNELNLLRGFLKKVQSEFEKHPCKSEETIDLKNEIVDFLENLLDECPILQEDVSDYVLIQYKEKER